MAFQSIWYHTNLPDKVVDALEEDAKTIFENEVKAQGLSILGWRQVPVDSSQLGEIALASEPNIEQLFVGKTKAIDEATFKAKLYAARKITEHAIRESKISESTLQGFIH